MSPRRFVGLSAGGGPCTQSPAGLARRGQGRPTATSTVARVQGSHWPDSHRAAVRPPSPRWGSQFNAGGQPAPGPQSPHAPAFCSQVETSLYTSSTSTYIGLPWPIQSQRQIIWPALFTSTNVWPGFTPGCMLASMASYCHETLLSSSAATMPRIPRLAGSALSSPPGSTLLLTSSTSTAAHLSPAP